jgi:hypothetical protein
MIGEQLHSPMAVSSSRSIFGARDERRRARGPNGGTVCEPDEVHLHS